MPLPYRWLGLAAVIVIFDQISKVLADRLLTLHDPIPFIPLINWMLAYNPGAAFSFLGDAGGWQRWFFTVLSLLVSGFLVVWLIKLRDTEKWTSISLALVLGGAVGNLIDRVLYGHVIDFIDFFYHSSNSCLPLFYPSGRGSCHWPTFNIADSAIFIGAILLIITSLFTNSHAPASDNK